MIEVVYTITQKEGIIAKKSNKHKLLIEITSCNS